MAMAKQILADGSSKTSNKGVVCIYNLHTLALQCLHDLTWTAGKLVTHNPE